LRTSSGRGLVGLLVLLSVAAWFLPVDSKAADEEIRIGRFSQQSPDAQSVAGWKALTFPKIKRLTHYALVREGARTVIKATSHASASGLITALDLESKDHPILSWSWKVDNLIEKADASRKEGDDYPARIYVTFRYDPNRVSVWQRAKYGTAKLLYGEYPPHRAISYVWDGKLPKGSTLPNAYTDRLQMIVVESGHAQLGEWQSYRRNVYEDYQAAFKEEPPPISGVAIMTDTDNTGESATAYYGDIIMTRRIP
jgi:hypothetical protein